jgi:hypothetical protein
VPNRGAEAVVEPETVSDPEVEEDPELVECGTGIDPSGFVGVGMTPVLVPDKVGMMPVDLGGRRLPPLDMDVLEIKAVLPVLVDVTPTRESTLEMRLPMRSPEVEVAVPVGVVDGELVAEAGTLTGMVGELKAPEDKVALVLLPVEDLSPRPKSSVRSNPELVVLELAVLELAVLEVAVLEVAVLEVAVLELLILLALEGPVDVAETGLLVVDSPTRPSSEARPPTRPLLEVLVEVWTEESTADPCFRVVSASVDAASELFLLVISVLEPSVCCVVVVVVAVGSPPMTVVPVIRCVISGFLGSIEIVTTTTSCPFWG